MLRVSSNSWFGIGQSVRANILIFAKGYGSLRDSKLSKLSPANAEEQAIWPRSASLNVIVTVKVMFEILVLSANFSGLFGAKLGFE